MSKKMVGRIKWFKPEKGYGYILGADEESYYFEVSSIHGEIGSFNAGVKVLFIPNMFTEVSYALDIELY